MTDTFKVGDGVKVAVSSDPKIKGSTGILKSVNTSADQYVVEFTDGSTVQVKKSDLKLDDIADDISEDEFTCSVCFLVLRNTQLAKPRAKVCIDCV